MFIYKYRFNEDQHQFTVIGEAIHIKQCIRNTSVRRWMGRAFLERICNATMQNLQKHIPLPLGLTSKLAGYSRSSTGRHLSFSDKSWRPFL